MRTVLILNPNSGASLIATQQDTPEQNEEKILAALQAYGVEPEVWYTTPEDSGEELARRAVEEHVELVIVAGGDGTLHAVATGLIGTESILGIIPTGTMNNIARSLQIPEDIEEACRIIAQGETSHIDVGKINGLIFLEVTGIGLEASLFPAAEDVKKYGFFSTVRGTFKGLYTLLTFKTTRFKIAFDGRRGHTHHAIQISVCNSPYYGARLPFAPTAVMDDGLLDMLLYKNFSKLDYILHAISISQGRRALATKVKRRKIKSIQIDCDIPLDIHADGELMGKTPATITVVPGALLVRVPTKVAKGPNIARHRTGVTQHSQLTKSSASTPAEHS